MRSHPVLNSSPQFCRIPLVFTELFRYHFRKQEKNMRPNSLSRFVLACIVASLLTVCAQAQKFSALYIFGDSYCDVGNIFAATSGAKPPAPPYFPGRFSNGPIWLDHVAGTMGLALSPSLLGGTDYAVGGAWATAPQSGPGFTIPSVPQQVGLYLQQHGGKADPNALYVLEGGGNDIALTTSGSPQKLGYEIAVALASSELLLRQAGARHFLIPNLFDVSILPVAAPNAAFAHAASVAANHWLNILLDLEGHLPRVSVIRVDVFDMFNAVVASPTHFGFTDITNPCVTTTVCAHPDHILFWDEFHLSEFGQTTLAVTVESALIANSRE
jgi:outer membrane lipase/esterase